MFVSPPYTPRRAKTAYKPRLNRAFCTGTNHRVFFQNDPFYTSILFGLIAPLHLYQVPKEHICFYTFILLSSQYHIYPLFRLLFFSLSPSRWSFPTQLCSLSPATDHIGAPFYRPHHTFVGTPHCYSLHTLNISVLDGINIISFPIQSAVVFGRWGRAGKGPGRFG